MTTIAIGQSSQTTEARFATGTASEFPQRPDRALVQEIVAKSKITARERLARAVVKRRKR